MNKAVKNRRRENLIAERPGRDSNQMGRSFLGEPKKHEQELNRQEASLTGCRATKRKAGRLIEKISCESAVAVQQLSCNKHASWLCR